MAPGEGGVIASSRGVSGCTTGRRFQRFNRQADAQTPGAGWWGSGAASGRRRGGWRVLSRTSLCNRGSASAAITDVWPETEMHQGGANVSAATAVWAFVGAILIAQAVGWYVRMNLA